MARKPANPDVTYTNVTLPKSLYNVYISGSNRPSISLLCECAITAYLNVENGQEIMMNNTLMTAEQMRKAFKEQNEEQIKIKNLVEAEKKSQEKSLEKTRDLYIEEAINMLGFLELVIPERTPRDFENNQDYYGRIRYTINERHKINTKTIPETRILEMYKSIKGIEA